MVSFNATFVFGAGCFTLAFTLITILSYRLSLKHYRKESRYLYAAGLFFGSAVYLIAQAFLENSRYAPDGVVVFWHRLQHAGLYLDIFILPLLVNQYRKKNLHSWFTGSTFILMIAMLVMTFSSEWVVSSDVHYFNNFAPQGKEGALYWLFQVWAGLSLGISFYWIIRLFPKRYVDEEPGLGWILGALLVAGLTAIFDMIGTFFTFPWLADVSLFSYAIVILCMGFGYDMILRSIRDAGRLAEANRTIRQQEQILVQNARIDMVARLASGVVHDMRNIMGVAQMASESLLQQALNREDAKSEEIAHKLRQSLDMARLLLENLHGFAKGEDRWKAQKYRFFIAADVFTVIREMLSYNIKKKGIELCIEVSPSLTLVGDRSQFLQVAGNILFNAEQVLESGGRISVSADIDEGMALLRFSDTGPGIDEETKKHIFEFLYTTREGGSGIGLYVARVIVEAYGGDIRCSRQDAETVFELRWPLAGNQKKENPGEN